MILTKGQKSALAKAKKWYLNDKDQVFKIQGLAGTGKTTIVFALINELRISLEDVLFVTYVGKATLPLRQNGLSAKTLHSTCYVRSSDYVLDEFGKPILLPSGRYKKKSTFVLKDSLPSNIKLIVLDEAPMSPKNMTDDLKSFGKKIIALGDKMQLPPVFGKSDILDNPDVNLTEIMRQKEGDPIIYLSMMARRGIDIPYGKYGERCFVVDDTILRNKEIYLRPDIIICGKNKTREKINNIIRYDIKHIKTEFPTFGEKLVCRKNNWDLEIDDIALINGLFGYVTNIDKESFNGNTFNIDFMPECLPGKWFEQVSANYRYLTAPIGDKPNSMYLNGNSFEFGNASTCHLAQGSQYGYVLGLVETMGNEEFQKRFTYTMITRAIHTLVLVKKRKPVRQFF